MRLAARWTRLTRAIKGELQNMDCPLCNGLIQVEGKCPDCGHCLEDGGTVESYFGPYSPNEEIDDELQGFLPEYHPNRCLHLLHCPACGWDKRIGIPKVHIE